MKKNTFKKAERLKSNKIISQLFQKGSHVFKYPIKLVYLPIHPGEHLFYFAVSVSKRKFKNAYARNSIKRKMRESYRLHKNDFTNQLGSKNHSYALMAIYIGQKDESYQKIEKSIINVFRQFLTSQSE